MELPEDTDVLMTDIDMFGSMHSPAAPSSYGLPRKTVKKRRGARKRRIADLRRERDRDMRNTKVSSKPKRARKLRINDFRKMRARRFRASEVRTSHTLLPNPATPEVSSGVTSAASESDERATQQESWARQWQLHARRKVDAGGFGVVSDDDDGDFSITRHRAFGSDFSDISFSAENRVRDTRDMHEMNPVDTVPTVMSAQQQSAAILAGSEFSSDSTGDGPTDFMVPLTSKNLEIQGALKFED